MIVATIDRIIQFFKKKNQILFSCFHHHIIFLKLAIVQQIYFLANIFSSADNKMKKKLPI